MKQFRIALLAMVVLGAVFGSGCSDMHQVFHERSGVYIESVTPSALYVTQERAATTTEAALYKYPDVRINFANSNAVPATVKAYRIDFMDTASGIVNNALTRTGITVLPVSGAVTNSGGTATTTTGAAETTATAATGTSTATSTDYIDFQLWTNDVIDAMYGNRTTTTDDKQMLATITFYGEDANGNTFQLQASVTMTP